MGDVIPLRDTKRDLDHAIEAHIRHEAEDDAIVTGYILYVAYLNADTPSGLTEYLPVIPSGQPFHSTLGLLYSAAADLSAPDDDDD